MEHKIIHSKINNFNKYVLLNKAQLSTHTTKLFISAYITSKFQYHILIWDQLSDNQKKQLEQKYSGAIKKTLKYPKWTNPKHLFQFYGINTLE